MKQMIFASMMAAALLGHSAARAAQEADTVATQDGIRYACTGVGAESREDPRWRSFPAKLVFAANDGGYLSHVRTRIADGKGQPVLDVQDCGPWLLVELPQGHYSVTSTAVDAQGRTFDSQASMSVGSGGQVETVVRFPGVAG